MWPSGMLIYEIFSTAKMETYNDETWFWKVFVNNICIKSVRGLFSRSPFVTIGKYNLQPKSLGGKGLNRYQSNWRCYSRLRLNFNFDNIFTFRISTKIQTSSASDFILSSIFSVSTTYTEMRISSIFSSIFNMMEQYHGPLVACTQCSVHLNQHTFLSMYKNVHLTLRARLTKVGHFWTFLLLWLQSAIHSIVCFLRISCVIWNILFRN